MAKIINITALICKEETLKNQKIKPNINVIKMEALVFFVYLAQIIIGAAFFSAILRKLNQPTLFAYIIAGIVIGPLVLGSIDFSGLNLPFDIGINGMTPELSLLASLGTAFLLFSIGIETSIEKLFKVGKPLILTTVLQTFALILITILLSTITGLLTFEQSLFIAIIISSSSTMIVIKVLTDTKEVNTLTGKVILSITLIQDFLIIFFTPLLTNITSLFDINFTLLIIGKIFVLIAIAVFLNKIVFPKLFEVASKEQELFFLVSIATAFFFIGIGYLLDLPISITGFIGGLSLSTLSFNTSIFSKVRALRDFFLIIFFVTLGIQINFSLGTLKIELILLLLFLTFILKPATLFVLTIFSGYGGKIGINSAFSLVQISEFGFYLAALGLTVIGPNGTTVIGEDLFSLLIILTAGSMLMAPYLITISDKAWNKIHKKNKIFDIFDNKFFARQILKLQNISTKKEMKNHIVIIGGNITGRELARNFLKEKEEVIIVDSNPDIISQGITDKLPFIYATSDDDNFLEKTDACEAKLIIITLKNIHEAKMFTTLLKANCPKPKIYCITHHFEEALDFYKKGVDFVAMPSLISATQLAELTYFGNKKINQSKYEQFRTTQMNYIKKQAMEDKKYDTRLVPKEN